MSGHSKWATIKHKKAALRRLFYVKEVSANTSLRKEKREFLPVRFCSRSAEIRGMFGLKAQTCGTAPVAAADDHQRALPSDTSLDLLFWQYKAA